MPKEKLEKREEKVRIQERIIEKSRITFVTCLRHKCRKRDHFPSRDLPLTTSKFPQFRQLPLKVALGKHKKSAQFLRDRKYNISEIMRENARFNTK